MAESWQPVSPLETEDRPVRRRPDVVALVAGIVFLLVAVAGLADIAVDLDVLPGGVVLAVLLVGAGVAILASELRRTRRRSGSPG